MPCSSATPNSARSGRRGRGLSLFHIDAGREWRGGQRQSFFLVRELRRRGWPLTFVVQPRSPLLEKASAEGLPVLVRRMRSELGFLAALRLGARVGRPPGAPGP